MPRNTNTSKDRCQAKTTTKQKLEKSEVDIDEPEKLISHYKRKIKEAVIHSKRVLLSVEPPNQNCDLSMKFHPSKVAANDDVSQATTSKVILLHEPEHVSKCSTQKKLCFPKGELEKISNLDGKGCTILNAQDVKKVAPPHNAQKHKRQKKVSFAKTCAKHDKSKSISPNKDSVESEKKLEFLPIITENCKKHIKHILLTAVQFQRHSRRKRLSAADVSKALALLRDFKEDSEVEDNAGHGICSEYVGDEEDKSVLLSCYGKWLQ